MSLHLFIIALIVIALNCCGAEARLHIEARRNGDVVMQVTGGTNNVQYQIFTEWDRNFAGTNWGYWRRAYPNTEILLTSTNTPWRIAGVYKIGGVLPD